MKLLFIDIDQELHHLFEHIDSMDDFMVDFCDSMESCSIIYPESQYDVIIINFTIDYGLDILNYIQSVNKTQKIITVSDELIHSEPKGECYCKTNYNKRRLLKPIDIVQLVQTLRDFDETTCKYAGKFESQEGIISIMGDIIRRFRGTSYDEQNQKIVVDSMVHMANIVIFLEEYSIEYAIQENTILLVQENGRSQI